MSKDELTAELHRIKPKHMVITVTVIKLWKIGKHIFNKILQINAEWLNIIETETTVL